jgi:hypothetical protein
MNTLSVPVDDGGGSVTGDDALLAVAVPPVAVPLTPRDRVSPAAVKVTLPAKAPAAVGWKRTTTFWVAPGASENDPPEAIRYGAPTLALPDQDEALVF